MTGAAADLTDLDLWERGVPYAEFARLRREAPVEWRRVAGFELAGPPRRIRSNFTNGLKELPVKVRLD